MRPQRESWGSAPDSTPRTLLAPSGPGKARREHPIPRLKLTGPEARHVRTSRPFLEVHILAVTTICARRSSSTRLPIMLPASQPHAVASQGSRKPANKTARRNKGSLCQSPSAADSRGLGVPLDSGAQVLDKSPCDRRRPRHRPHDNTLPAG